MQAREQLRSLERLESDLEKLLRRVDLVSYREADDLEEWEKEEEQAAESSGADGAGGLHPQIRLVSAKSE